jgi:hypothetical protein
VERCQAERIDEDQVPDLLAAVDGVTGGDGAPEGVPDQ